MSTKSLVSEIRSDDRGSDDDKLLLLPSLLSTALVADSCSCVEQEDLGETSVSINSKAAARQRVRNMGRIRRGRKLTLPPPMSSIGGSTGIQMRSRREDGRLVVNHGWRDSSRRAFFKCRH
ncbi:unnamed protein product [Linum trigynum]|uniref:FAF domain-containing protein n=1 Tax=Linum trigynum TaxID=586398 RepID=A0AAV2ETZ0_9ROSI